MNVIQKEYLPRAMDPEVLRNDRRSLEEQLASLHLYNVQWNCPTNAAVIMFGKYPKYFMPGAYIQYVRFKGNDNGGEILNERRFEGGLYTVLPQLENFIRDGIVTKRPVPVSILREKDVLNYPFKALRELMMNAVMHRDYQSNMPVRLYQYDRHIEVMNPGGLYGQARPENFPNVNDYRNSVVAEMMRTLNYVNMFNHGVREVQDQLHENENPPAKFNVDYLTAFSVIVRESDDDVLVDNVRVGDLGDKTTQKSREKSREKILRIITKNQNVTIAELSEEMGVSIKAVEKHIKNLKNEKILRRVGPDKGGHWEVVSSAD